MGAELLTRGDIQVYDMKADVRRSKAVKIPGAPFSRPNDPFIFDPTDFDGKGNQWDVEEYAIAEGVQLEYGKLISRL